MTVKRLLFFIIFCFITGSLFSQISNIPGFGNEVIREKKYTDVEGSPYLFPDWKTGSITDHAGKVYPNQLIKYNSYEDVIEINQEGRTLVLNNLLYPKFEFIGMDEVTNLQIHRIFQSGFSVQGYAMANYFEVLFIGNYKFLKKTKTEYMDQNVSSYGSTSVSKRFITKESYIIIDKSEKSFECRLSKKSLLEALGKDKVLAESFIAKTRIKVKSEADFIEILSSLQ